MADGVQVHDFFYPCGNFVACWTSCFVEVYCAVLDVFFCWSSRGRMPVFWVGRALCFRQQFTFDFPWRDCSRHIGFFSPNCCKKKMFEVIKV